MSAWELIDDAGLWLDGFFGGVLVALAIADQMLMRRWSR